MTTTTFQTETSLFIDRRRVAWLLATALMLLPMIGIGLRESFGSDLWLFAPTFILYGLVPLLDLLIGEDSSNPAESDVPQLEADHYYRWIVYLSLPLLWGTLAYCCWYAVNADLSWYGYLGLSMAAGWTAGAGINAAHELGHKKPSIEKWLAKLALAPSAYGHFNIEHNRGHHRDVATPEDPVSSRLGESYYRFIRREIPGGARRAWQLETARLDRKSVGHWSLENDIVQTGLITFILWAGLVAWLGVAVIPLLLLQAVFGYSLLSSANYIEHYGLLRQKLDNGRYERPEPRHSWNSNHVLSNILLYQLQRHSDHHAHPTRRYQSLRHFEEAPQLPSGYFGMFLIAFIPPLWYRIMDPKVLAHADKDISRINMDPARSEELQERYGL
jgi:alkane 1-monooxygenase